MIYKRFARGEGANIYEHVIYPENYNFENVIKKSGVARPYYLSLFNYTEEHYNNFIQATKKACDRYEIPFDESDLINIRSKVNFAISKEKRSTGKAKEEAMALQLALSFAGTENLKTNRLIFDFDSHEDKDTAKEETLTLIRRLVEHKIPEDSIQICFSGNKGFAVEVTVEEELSKDEFINIVDNLALDLKTFDRKIRDYQRVFRVPLTRHGITGLYKTPLFAGDLEDLSIAEIIEIAKVNDPASIDIIKSWKPTRLNKLEEYRNIEINKKDEVPNLREDSPGLSESLDLDKKPSWLTPEKFALQEGFFGFEQGERNDGFMILAATYRNQGFHKDIATRMLQGVADLQASRSGRDKFSDREIEKNIIDVVYSPTWRGGMYTIKHNQLLQKTAERFGLKPTEEGVDPNFENIDKMLDDFYDYAKGFSHNVIKTGIPSFDESVLLTTGQLMSLVGSPGSGKCLAKDTPVLMYNGSIKKVQDIVVGDLLMGPDSTSRKVLSLARGQEEMYDVIPIKGEKWGCNASHILSMRISPKKIGDDKNKIVNMSINEFLKQNNTFKHHAKLWKTGVEFSKKEVTLDPYVLGLWLGDGTSAKAQFNNPDKEIRDYLNDYFCNKHGMIQKNYMNELTFDFVGYEKGDTPTNNFLLDQLAKYNLRYNKHIPTVYLRNDRENRLKLLAGLLDSDGYYGTGVYEIITKSDEMCEQILYLVRSLGLAAYATKKIGSIKSIDFKGIYNRISISGDLDIIPCKVERKKAKLRNKNKNVLNVGFTLEPKGVGDYYGFEIDGDHLFLLGDFTVTHNTAWSNAFVENVSMSGGKVLFFSMDMSKQLLLARIMQRHANGLDYREILHKIENDIYDHDIDIAKSKVKEYYKNVRIDTRSGLSVDEIIKTTQNYQKSFDGGLKLVVIDYLEKIIGVHSDNSVSATANIVARLGDLAKDQNIALLLLVQPQKSAGNVWDDLTMRSIKGTSVIEQDSRIIMGISRPGARLEDRKRNKDVYAFIDVLKQNMGETGRHAFKWNGKAGQLIEMTDEDKSQLDELINEIELREATKAAKGMRKPN